ncbi:MAG: 2,3-bisphosphoglycerate-independent phosphoglycerate mutase [Acidobacteria bacterium]|nr:2,3-bisphosphoglycerate-independent phosphoglycerate mutase [Acidobacteriota bacterium]
MAHLDFYRSLAVPSDRRILFMVLDGLGGLPHVHTGETELEAAKTPNLDRLAARGELGLSTPILPGVTPGSGPAHIGLFGYDPVEHQVGRGVLAALGVGADLRPGDVAARINFCSLNAEGQVTDRRAGRIGDEIGAPLAERLDAMPDPAGVEMRVRHVKQYRACVILRGAGLEGDIADTDPLVTGVPPLAPVAQSEGSERAAALVADFVTRAADALDDQGAANGVLLRGFDGYSPLPTMGELYGLTAAAVAAYPMYLGVARLAGMAAHPVKDEPDAMVEQVKSLDGADFVFLHYKSTDSKGEDGDFDAKVAEVEKADGVIGRLVEDFDVVMVTGDHSTPSRMSAHSWHPVPLLIAGPDARSQNHPGFGERECVGGSLGHVSASDVLPLVLAHAGRLRKFGA